MSNNGTLRSRSRTPLTFVLGLLCTAAIAAGCSSDSGSKASTSRPSATGTEVDIKDFAFGPATLSVTVGGKVTFKNTDGQPHTATSDTSGAFDAGAIDPGASKDVTFDKAGTFTYHCSFHPFMHGTIEVK